MRYELAELARLFLRLGTTALGGPAAHIALMDDEVVGRRRRLTREQFLDYVSATNLIPGPNSTELAIHSEAGMIAAMTTTAGAVSAARASVRSPPGPST